MDYKCSYTHLSHVNQPYAYTFSKLQTHLFLVLLILDIGGFSFGSGGMQNVCIKGKHYLLLTIPGKYKVYRINKEPQKPYGER